MFVHNFKYALKTLFGNKMLIFWTFAFPIILGTFFNMAFSDIESSEKLEIIDIAIVNNEDFKKDEVLKQVFERLSDKRSEEQLFRAKYVNRNEAKKLLLDDKISGYILVKGENVKVVVATSGINQTILKYTVDEILQTKKMIHDSVENEIQEVKIKNISRSNLSYTMIEFYTLIAMACMYGGILGMAAINNNLPNMTKIGKRVGVSPVSKWKLVLSSVLAGYVTQLIGIALLFVYTIFVLKVDYGNNLPFIILLALAGCLAGLSMGIAIGTLLKSGENTKTGIVIGVTMLGSFLSGMMGITMKYIVDTHLPFVNKINPVAMITDGFYSLYYYDTLNRYFFNVTSLFVFAFIMISLSFISLRRQTYDCI